MLTISNIRAVYGGVVLALDELSMTITEGSVVVLLGSNGSGKSTTLKSISGVLRTEDGELTKGRIELNGRRLDRLTPEEIVRLGVSHVLQGRAVFPQLTTEENLLMGAYLRHDKQGIEKDLARIYGYFPKLVALQGQKCGYLSGGEQQMVVISRAFMGRPRLMLLDEPSLGLAPGIIRDIFAILKQMKETEGTTLLIAEQNASAALAIADYGYVLQNGRVIAEGPAQALKNREQVKGAYLGLNQAGNSSTT